MIKKEKTLMIKRQNSFFKSITTLASGSMLAQLITIIASPITTRIFTPQELGIYTLLITAVNLFGPMICGRYDLVIVTEKDDRNMLTLLKASVFLSLGLSLLVSVGYYVYLKCTSNYSYLILLMFILFVLLFLSGITNVLNSYNNRFREYSLMTSVYVIRTTVQNIVMILTGFFRMGVSGLLCSQLISQLSGINRQAKSLKKNFDTMKTISISEMWLMVKKYKQQFFFSTPASFANSFSYSSINIFVENMFGVAVLGYYSISYRVLGLPLNIISTNVSKVFFEEAAKEYNSKGNYLGTVKKTSIFLLVIAIPMVAIMILVSPTVFSIVFGNEWKEAGIYVQILAPMFGFRFIVSALSTALIISQKQNFELIIQVLFILASIVIYAFVSLNHLDIYIYLALISFIYSIIYIFYYFFILLCAK